MWNKVASFILRYRVPIFSVLMISTALMAYLGIGVQMDYTMAKVIPEDNLRYTEFMEFRQQFGADGNIMVLAVQHDDLFDKDFFNAWQTFGDSVSQVGGVDQVLGLGHAYNLVKNTEEGRFEMQEFPDGSATSQAKMDSIKALWLSLPFYENVVYNPETQVTVMAARFNDKGLRSREKVYMVEQIEALAKNFEQRTSDQVHLSGLPFIRSFRITMISRELFLVLIYAVIILIAVLLFLFRSVSAVIFPLIVVAIGVAWAMGLMVLFGFKITLLTGLIPNLMVIIGIPNCVYLLNKYHSEYRKHGNKVRALSTVIQRIGFVTFFANLTTAIGFGVFYFTGSSILEEFGIIAGIMVGLLFIISIITIPVVFSFLPEPSVKHVKHLDRPILEKMILRLDDVTIKGRKVTYTFATIVVVLAAFGVTKLKTQGFMLDDVPKDSAVYQDLKFLEKHFTGVMPLEILVDTKRPNGAISGANLKKIEDLEAALYADSLFSKPTSVTAGLKFATQAYYNGNPERYRLPRSSGLTPEMSFIMRYLSGMAEHTKEMASGEGQQLMNNFLDSTRQVARVSMQIPDIGSGRLDELYAKLDTIVKPIFPDSTYQVTYTGTSIVAMEGYRFLTNGLMNSVGMAFILIALIMAYLFRSVRMLIISLIPNIIPLFLTAGIMGYANISLKPSTVLVFSVAFGISVDFTIHFLAKYRQELTRHKWDIAKTVTETINETGTSMVYTSLILFFGFITFTTSSFDGTKYMGLLVSITLVASLFSNLILLPSLLLSFDRVPKRKRYLLEEHQDT